MVQEDGLYFLIFAVVAITCGVLAFMWESYQKTKRTRILLSQGLVVEKDKNGHDKHIRISNVPSSPPPDYSESIV